MLPDFRHLLRLKRRESVLRTPRARKTHTCWGDPTFSYLAFQRRNYFASAMIDTIRSRRGFLKGSVLAGTASLVHSRVFAASPRTSVVVVGAGAFGGWSALQLQQSGAKVILLDSWGPGNSRASSGLEFLVQLRPESMVLRVSFGCESQ